MKAMGLACLGIGIAVAGSLSLASARGFRPDAGPPENFRHSGPQLFGPGVLSTPDDEFGGTLSPDGRTFLYCKSVPRSQFYIIVESHQDGGRWSAPRIASFSGRYRDSDPVFSRDGSRVTFVSDRPVAGVDRKNFDVWSVARRKDGWGEPENLGPPVNSDKNEYFVSFTRDGTIYFTSAREGSRGPIDVWRSRWADGRYGEPENLGEAINGKNWLNVEAWIAEDESFLLVGAFGHTDGPGDSDIFVSYRKDGVFGPLRPLGPEINTAAREYSPRISLDGQWLFFTSERGMPTQGRTRPWSREDFQKASTSIQNGLGNIYRIRLAEALAQPPAAERAPGSRRP
jgi:WD40-like Beta Propeller Repeat